jgi:hypothetical protein
MTKYKTYDEERTVELVRQLDSDTSWLRHRGRAAELDRRLLNGASSSELSEVRGDWKVHINHLRKVHRLSVVEAPPGCWRIDGALGEMAQKGLYDADASDELESDSDYEDGAPNEAPQETAPTESGHYRLNETAKALAALAREGLLGNGLLKASVGMLIRQASESQHWHNCAHFRSQEAAALIRAANLKTASQYQAWCRKNLRHEHVVPNSVVYKMLCAQGLTESDKIAELLKNFCLRATITLDEDDKLTEAGYSSRMPEGFDLLRPTNPLARYVAVGLGDKLDKRPEGKLWHEVQ